MPEDTGQKVGRAKPRPFSCAGLTEQGTRGVFHGRRAGAGPSMAIALGLITGPQTRGALRPRAPSSRIGGGRVTPGVD